MKIRLFFAWYDLFVGVFWSRKNRTLYLLLFPTLGVRIQFVAIDAPWRGIADAIGK